MAEENIKWLFAVVIRDTATTSSIGPFLYNSKAEAVAIEACKELGLNWDGEHMCSEDYIFQPPGQATLPNVSIESMEVYDPFINLLWGHVARAALDGDR